ncbi:MAG: bifunctional enoyl-CoA hydratase/phosphate acetyltransferase [Alphaproteobacteria bacterium]|nr:bifunctional enoyl-CoA hydratase/phosphate acetyltransferase [Alphaproteobacteria bacterium]
MARPGYVCPEHIIEAARQREPLPVAVVAAHSPLALESARRAQDMGVMEPVLVGDQDVIHRLADSMDWDLNDVQIVPAADDADAARRAVALARSGEVGALMKGHLHTDTLLLAALDKRLGLRTGRRFTHAFHLTIPGWKDLILSDCAVNIAPNLDTKLDIIRNAVDLAHALGNANPKVAILSCTEEVTDRVQSAMDAAELTRRCAEGAVQGAVVFGPLAFDLAISDEAVRIKGFEGNPVAGRADILVVPSIETGNALFKTMVHFLGATAAGVVLGASVPILLTSRADPPEARIASAAIARLLVPEGWEGAPHKNDRPEGLHA